MDKNIDSINPDELSNGVMHWHKNRKMDDLMNFLARYVRSVHADRYFRKVLLNHPGGTYLDIITPSDIAYVISVIKNSAHLWLLKREDTTHEETDNDHLTHKALFTAGQKKKRTFGTTTWNKLGIEYYAKAHENRKNAFTKNDPQYVILRTYWNKWIADKGKKIMVGSTIGVKKSIHSILGTRDVRDINMIQGSTKSDDEVTEDDNEFEYESDPDYDTIHFSNWNAKNDVDNLGDRRHVNIHSDEDDDDEENDEVSLGEQSSDLSMNAIQEEMEREAISADIGSRRKRSRVNNEEANTARKETMRRTNGHIAGRSVRISTG